MRYVLIDDGRVTNRVIFDAVMPEGWAEEGETWIANDEAQIGWSHDGKTFAPPERPPEEPPPTAEQLRVMDAAEVEQTFTVPSILRAMVKDRFDLENRVRALEGKQPITIAQFKSALAARIRGNT